MTKHPIIAELEEGLRHLKNPFHVDEIVNNNIEATQALIDHGYAKKSAQNMLPRFNKPYPVFRADLIAWANRRRKRRGNQKRYTKRQEEAVSLRRQGSKYRDIARRLGVSVIQAFRLVRKGEMRESEISAKREAHIHGNQQM